MPYSTTAARNKALLRVKNLRVPFVYAKVRTRKLPTYVRDAVFQNCVFQLSAVFEDYIFDLLSGWFLKLQSNGANAGALPALTRSLAIIKSQEENFRRYIGDRDEATLAANIFGNPGVYLLMQDTEAIPSVDLDNLILKDKKFPSVRNLNVIFKRVGLPKISQEISRRTRLTFELNWQSFMDIRNALAHESPPSITDEDVDRYFSQIKKWVNAVDRTVYSHVVAVSGSGYW